MDWDKLRIFHAVATAGSLTHAGETLRLSQSAVSRQVSALEESVGAPLFHRHPRGLILTGEGELLYEATKAMASELSAASARIRDTRESVNGALRVTTTVGFGSLWLAPRFPKLFQQYTNLSIDLVLTEGLLDIAMREADLAIRMRAPIRADIIQRPLATMHMRVYASEAYLAAAEPIVTLSDLAKHPIIAYSPDAPQPLHEMDWLTRGKRKLRTVLTVNNHYGMLQAVRNGLGVAPLPDYMTVGVPELRLVLPEIVGPEFQIHLAYPVELRNSKRVAAFREFLVAEMAAFGGFGPKHGS